MRYFYCPGDKDTYEYFVELEDDLPISKKLKKCTLYKFSRFWYRHKNTGEYKLRVWMDNDTNGILFKPGKCIETTLENVEQHVFIENI